jgi:hypothetical protein
MYALMVDKPGLLRDQYGESLQIVLAELLSEPGSTA